MSSVLKRSSFWIRDLFSHCEGWIVLVWYQHIVFFFSYLIPWCWWATVRSERGLRLSLGVGRGGEGGGGFWSFYGSSLALLAQLIKSRFCSELLLCVRENNMTSKKGRSYKQLKHLLWTKKRIILQLSLITPRLFGNMHNATNLQADSRQHIENEKASNTFNRTLT